MDLNLGETMTIVEMNFFEKLRIIFSIPYYLINELIPKTKKQRESEYKKYLEGMRQYYFTKDRKQDGDDICRL